MQGVNNFIIRPLKSRYTNTRSIEGADLILNTDNYNHRYVSKRAVVTAIPSGPKTEVKVGDEVLVHHNVFRRWKDVRGVEKNSKSFYKEDMYFVHWDQVFAYKRNGVWNALETYCFVKPIKSNDIYNIDKEQPLIGVLKYADSNLIKAGLKQGDLVGFKPNTEYECILDEERLYRIFSKSITMKYEYQGNEEEYNPSWTQSG
jgi:hypothetical protein